MTIFLICILYLVIGLLLDIISVYKNKDTGGVDNPIRITIIVAWPIVLFILIASFVFYLPNKLFDAYVKFTNEKIGGIK